MAKKTKPKAASEIPIRRPGRPSGSDVGDMKLLFLEAAIKLFGSRGFDGVSLSQIASQAGADVGLTRYYFGSKAELWEAAMSHLAEQFENEVSQALLPDSPSKTEDLKCVIRAFVAASAKWPEVSRIMVFDGDKSDARGDFIKDRFVRPFYEALAGLISGAKDEGSLPSVSERTIFFMITHGGAFPMALPALTNAFPGEDIHSAEGLRAHADAIIELLFFQR